MSQRLDILLLREAVEYLIAWGSSAAEQTDNQKRLLQRASLALKAVSAIDVPNEESKEPTS